MIHHHPKTVVEPPFESSYGLEQKLWAEGVLKINRKSSIYWWAVQGSNLRPPD